RVIAVSDYDAAILARPAGPRRLANVRKLMRLGREWEAQAGFDLRGFLAFIQHRAWGGPGGGGTDAGRESEAPVESEGLDAVRLMTIHRAKGLEFPVVCVADLGRGPTFRPDLIRIGRDGSRLGLRLARPGTAARLQALDYAALGDEAAAAGEAEERRLFYVAMTRARDRLILSGAADLQGRSNRSTPIGWIAPAFGAELTPPAEPSFTTDFGVRVTFVSETDSGRETGAMRTNVSQSAPPLPVGAVAPSSSPAVSPRSPQTSSLSYSSLALYERCGYRFYAERVLGLPQTPAAAPQAAQEQIPPEALPAADRGTLVHQALQDLDLRHPVIPAVLHPEVRRLVDAFLASEIRTRLAAATDVRREQRFAFPLGHTLVAGAFDALATEPDGGMLVVDYKTDRLHGRSPAEVVDRDYPAQRLIYALAALRAGAPSVEVVHLFLEDTDHPAARRFGPSDLASLEAELERRAAPLLSGRFEVTAEPQLAVCAGCPALGGLCSWPAEMSMRPAADRLF
ncbi:MAG TPA: PD-(D/E)XK nuclease family protein, partial [Solirubrobacteraceae bacterium]|nr:PD-(D/E)XK nuclease family protein [Solirubrobacteraceae bacterium]